MHLYDSVLDCDILCLFRCEGNGAQGWEQTDEMDSNLIDVVVWSLSWILRFNALSS